MNEGLISADYPHQEYNTKVVNFRNVDLTVGDNIEAKIAYHKSCIEALEKSKISMFSLLAIKISDMQKAFEI